MFFTSILISLAASPVPLVLAPAFAAFRTSALVSFALAPRGGASVASRAQASAWEAQEAAPCHQAASALRRGALRWLSWLRSALIRVALGWLLAHLTSSGRGHSEFQSLQNGFARRCLY